MDKDRLFIVTAKNNAMILEAQGSGINLEIITKGKVFSKLKFSGDFDHI